MKIIFLEKWLKDNINIFNFEKLVTKIENDIEIKAYYNCEAIFDDCKLLQNNS